MDQGRQATRPDAVVVNIVATNTAIAIVPLGWRQRNDLGDLISQKFTEALTSVIASQKSDKRLFLDKVMPYDEILKAAGISEEQLTPLVWSELQAVCMAVLEVNGLENMRGMLDPNYVSPIVQKALGLTSDGEKITSSPASSESG